MRGKQAILQFRVQIPEIDHLNTYPGKVGNSGIMFRWRNFCKENETLNFSKNQFLTLTVATDEVIIQLCDGVNRLNLQRGKNVTDQIFLFRSD